MTMTRLSILHSKQTEDLTSQIAWGPIDKATAPIFSGGKVSHNPILKNLQREIVLLQRRVQQA
jgi:hypothetical protein